MDIYRKIQNVESRGHWGIKPSLANPTALLEGLGHPEQSFPAVLIAGTNGKGSTGAFMASALRSAGHRVGWTTSPHLVSPTERIWIDGAPISLETLDRLLDEVLAAEARLGIEGTYFELMMACAILAFREAKVDIALVEVGMGGRWDAANALDPILSVLTNIALEHTAFLGDTREAIAREKLCTARTGRPLVLGDTLEPAWIQPLLECQPRLIQASRQIAETLAWDHSVVQGHRIGLAGPHQLSNLGTALCALDQLRQLGFQLPEEALWRGIETTRWPGRFWQVPGLDRVWMDGAHNPDGAAVLARHARSCGVKPHLYFGSMGDKDLEGVARELRSIAPLSITLAKGENERYATAEALLAIWGEDLRVLDIESLGQELRQPCEAPRLVTGSLYLIGDILRTMGIAPYGSD
ncbi:MAG: bifunctional folylpolyglutamate synthase/dihydrofolate synthase [Holophagaceae bacterium]|nr:bifunctional folylpolyglutamate synthase/dihydrofolate synthase [Holophagaceae bacterium]